MGTEIKFSTANHPQTDGQSERANRVVGDILRAYGNYRQCDWDEHLPLCEFAMNDMIQESIQQTPFFANYGWHPRSGGDFKSSLPTDNHLSGNSRLPWLERQREVLQMVRDSMIAAQARQSFYTDLHRHDISFQVGEEVLVHRDFLCDAISRGQPSNKLRPVWLGPFKIVQKLSSTALKLELPPECRAHPVFYASALKHYHRNEIPGRTQPPPPPVIDLDGHTRYIVDKILHHRQRFGRRQYLVKWLGYQRPTWEPEVNLKDESGQEVVQLKDYLREIN